MSETAQIKSALFGEVGRIKATGGHKVNQEKLLKPLEWEKGIMKIFCEGCGTLLEMNKVLVDKLAEEAKIDLPPNLKEFYFKVNRCGLCESDELPHIELIPLPRSVS